MQPQQSIQPIYTSPQMQPSGGWTRKQKLVMLSTGIFAGVMLLIFLLVAIFSGGQSANQVSLTVVNARNSEILALLDEFESDLHTAEGNEYVARAKALIASDDLSITNYLTARYSTTPSDQQIKDLDFTTISTELESATSQSSFDEFFISTVNSEIDTNKTLLEKLDPTDIDTVLEIIVSTSIANYDSLLN